jgi:hypothetical protein
MNGQRNACHGGRALPRRAGLRRKRLRPAAARRFGGRRAVGLAAALTGIAVLAAGCGGGSSASAHSKAYDKSLAFVQCMQSHGMPTFPDPASNGTISDSGANVNSPQVLSAANACRTLLPPGALQLTEAQKQELLDNALKKAVCMRAHGISNYPDPSVQADGLPRMSLNGTGIDPDSPFFLSAAKACNLRRFVGTGSGPGQKPGGGGS